MKCLQIQSLHPFLANLANVVTIENRLCTGSYLPAN
jgi:hypothetical protein